MSQEVQEKVVEKKKRSWFRPIKKAVFWTVLLPYHLWFFTFRRKAIPDSATIYCVVDRGFFFWILIAGGFGLSLLSRVDPQAAGFAGKTYAWLTVWLLVSLAYDLNALKIGLWALVFGFVWFALKYVEHVRNIAILGPFSGHLGNLDPQLHPGYASFIAWVLLIPFVHSVIQVFIRGVKRFTPNEISEFYFMEGQDLSDRQGLKFKARYRDLFETILTFGGGDIIVTDNSHNEFARYSNVLFLFFIWPRLDRILHQRSVVEDEEKEEAVA